MNSNNIIDSLIRWLKIVTRYRIVVYSKERSFQEREILTKLEKKTLSNEGRLIDYQGVWFYVSIRSEIDIKSRGDTVNEQNTEWANDLEAFFSNARLDLYLVNRNSKNTIKKIVSINFIKYLSFNRKSIDIYRIANDINKFIYSNSVRKTEERCKCRSRYLLCKKKQSKPQFQTYQVLYGTNRKEGNHQKGNTISFREKRNKKLSLGQCCVSIPKKHRQGELERPGWLYKHLFGESPKKHFTILDNNVVNQNHFIKLLKEKFEDSGANDVLLFIHGFNTSFKDAIYRTAQLGYDLCFRGAVTAFSWPSQGRGIDYISDIQSAEYSIPFLSDFIELILSSSNIGRFHIIAHSMGNLILCKALEKLNSKGIYPNSIINQIILAAPDIDRDVFFTQILPIIKTTPNITLYACDKDNALKISRKLRSNYIRLGEGGNNLLVADGLDSIDASEVKMTTLGHTYFAQETSLLNEIHMVLENLPPNSRMLQECFNAKQQKYWKLKRT